MSMAFGISNQGKKECKQAIVHQLFSCVSTVKTTTKEKKKNKKESQKKRTGTRNKEQEQGTKNKKIVNVTLYERMTE